MHTLSGFLRKTAFGILMVLIASCSRDRNRPGHAYFFDMSESGAYEYYSENPNFQNGMTAQQPALGSIPRGVVPYQYPRTEDGQKRAGLELVNVISNSPEEVLKGKEKFEFYCAMCHGLQGKGDGYLVTTKKFRKDIPSLVGDFVQNKPDGELFHVITQGSVSGFMGSHSWQLLPDDRWRVVRYIKNGLKKNG